jgi:hypothetical protein
VFNDAREDGVAGVGVAIPFTRGKEKGRLLDDEGLDVGVGELRG